MEPLIIHEQPPLKSPVLIAAYGGWPDAQEGATGALRFLIRKLSAKKFAEIDPEEFYIFTRVRPATSVNERGERILRWPTNEFFYAPSEGVRQDLLLFVGVEPHLRWRAFTGAVLSLAERCQVRMILFLGSLLDAIPHTREPRVSGLANTPELRKALEKLGVLGSTYQGPAGAPTALMEACTNCNLTAASLWVHAPQYIQAAPNPRISIVLLKKLSSFLGLQVPTGELGAAGTAFEAEVEKAVGADAELIAYVKKLEEQYDQATEAVRSQEELPSPEAVVQDLEEFLRQQQKGNRETGP